MSTNTQQQNKGENAFNNIIFSAYKQH